MNVPTQSEMAAELSDLAKHMRVVSDRLLYVAGFNDEKLGHSMELLRASNTVAQWARALKPKRKKLAKKRG